MAFTVAELKEIVLTSANDAWQDDAAEELAFHGNWGDAQHALFELINGGNLDESLERTCLESLAEIWRQHGVDAPLYERLSADSRTFIDVWLAAGSVQQLASVGENSTRVGFPASSRLSSSTAILLAWCFGVAVHAWYYASSILALPDGSDEYANTWSFQLLVFAFFRFPLWLIGLLVLLLVHTIVSRRAPSQTGRGQP